MDYDTTLNSSAPDATRGGWQMLSSCEHLPNQPCGRSSDTSVRPCKGLCTITHMPKIKNWGAWGQGDPRPEEGARRGDLMSSSALHAKVCAPFTHTPHSHTCKIKTEMKNFTCVCPSPTPPPLQWHYKEVNQPRPQCLWNLDWRGESRHHRYSTDRCYINIF